MPAAFDSFDCGSVDTSYSSDDDSSSTDDGLASFMAKHHKPSTSPTHIKDTMNAIFALSKELKMDEDESFMTEYETQQAEKNRLSRLTKEQRWKEEEDRTLSAMADIRERHMEQQRRKSTGSVLVDYKRDKDVTKEITDKEKAKKNRKNSSDDNTTKKLTKKEAKRAARRRQSTGSVLGNKDNEQAEETRALACPTAKKSSQEKKKKKLHRRKSTGSGLRRAPVVDDSPARTPSSPSKKSKKKADTGRGDTPRTQRSPSRRDSYNSSANQNETLSTAVAKEDRSPRKIIKDKRGKDGKRLRKTKSIGTIRLEEAGYDGDDVIAVAPRKPSSTRKSSMPAYSSSPSSFSSSSSKKEVDLRTSADTSAAASALAGPTSSPRSPSRRDHIHSSADQNDACSAVAAEGNWSPRKIVKNKQKKDGKCLRKTKSIGTICLEEEGDDGVIIAMAPSEPSSARKSPLHAHSSSPSFSSSSTSKAADPRMNPPSAPRTPSRRDNIHSSTSENDGLCAVSAEEEQSPRKIIKVRRGKDGKRLRKTKSIGTIRLHEDVNDSDDVIAVTPSKPSSKEKFPLPAYSLPTSSFPSSCKKKVDPRTSIDTAAMEPASAGPPSRPRTPSRRDNIHSSTSQNEALSAVVAEEGKSPRKIIKVKREKDGKRLRKIKSIGTIRLEEDGNYGDDVIAVAPSKPSSKRKSSLPAYSSSSSSFLSFSTGKADQRTSTETSAVAPTSGGRQSPSRSPSRRDNIHSSANQNGTLSATEDQSARKIIKGKREKDSKCLRKTKSTGTIRRVENVDEGDDVIAVAPSKPSSMRQFPLSWYSSSSFSSSSEATDGAKSPGEITKAKREQECSVAVDAKDSGENTSTTNRKTQKLVDADCRRNSKTTGNLAKSLLKDSPKSPRKQKPKTRLTKDDETVPLSLPPNEQPRNVIPEASSPTKSILKSPRKTSTNNTSSSSGEGSSLRCSSGITEPPLSSPVTPVKSKQQYFEAMAEQAQKALRSSSPKKSSSSSKGTVYSDFAAFGRSCSRLRSYG